MSEASLPSSYLEQYLEPYRDLILKDDIIELAINPDGNVWIERQGAHAMERIDRTVEVAAAANLAATLVGDARARQRIVAAAPEDNRSRFSASKFQRSPTGLPSRMRMQCRLRSRR